MPAADAGTETVKVMGIPNASERSDGVTVTELGARTSSDNAADLPGALLASPE